MKSINPDELDDLMMHGRQKQIKFVSIAEKQINELKEIFKSRNLRTVAQNNKPTVYSYYVYNILSDEEYKELIELLK